ncbi:MAG: hypothetical protein LBJ00_04745 [Planctomycetaceae bacterium]|nr:hypothetical protein [Planctomycetaceae bacterium]
MSSMFLLSLNPQKIMFKSITETIILTSYVLRISSVALYLFNGKFLLNGLNFQDDLIVVILCV